MFNRETPINVNVNAAGRITPTSVRWPTDEEWIVYRRKLPTVVRILSRGRSEPEPESPLPAVDLYQAIQLNGAPSLTPPEAKALVDGLTEVRVVSCQLAEDSAVIEMETIHGPVTHTLRMPTMDLIREFQLTTHTTSLPNSRFQIRHSVQNAGLLWDKCKPEVEGYEGTVPILHKDIAIRHVIETINQAMVPAVRDDEDF